MPEKVESILRAIHILFSKGEMYHELPDKVILSKREMFDLLEKLNYAVVEVMDRYEATTASKEKAKKQMEEMGQKIIDQAGKEAEDVYAASMLYTDGALNDLYAIVDDAKLHMKKEYGRFEESLNRQMEVIRSNQQELLMQLRALAQGQKYLDLIEEYNEAHMTHEEETEEEEDEFFEEDSDSGFSWSEEAADNMQERKEKAKAKKKKKTEPKAAVRKIIPAGPVAEDEEEIWEEAPVRQKVEVKVHSGGGIPENSIFNENALKTKKDRKREEKLGKQGKNRADGEEIPGLAEKLGLDNDPQEISFSSEALDAEYEDWQQETAEQKEAKSEKGKTGFFDRLKDRKR